MDLISFINSSLGPRLGLFIARYISRKQAYWLADWMTGLVVKREDSWVVQGVRANQSVVRGIPYESPDLDKAVYEVIRNTARGYADWYRAVAGGPEVVKASVIIEDELKERVFKSVREKHGVLFVGPHMSSFNVMLLGIGVMGHPVQALSYPEVRGSYIVDNEVRKKFGVNITPISFQTLREAIKRLRNYGFVMTGVDRPDVGGEPLTFFGRKVVLPIGHARLAIRTGANVLVGRVEDEGNGYYRGHCEEFIEPESTGDEDKDVLSLAQRIIMVVEDLIRASPSEWLMFHAVWPDVLPSQRDTE
ncbi:MAG TPA: lysophospholipid acyltransferase family protein [Anaerolineae bacterium]|nr:lysophospholipid acyltransferase family protein [Anaerolineae bacterium]